MAQVNVVCVHVSVAPHIPAKGRMAINPVKVSASHVRAIIVKSAPTKPLRGEAMALATTPTQKEWGVSVPATTVKVVINLAKVTSLVPVTIKAKAISLAKAVTSSVKAVTSSVKAVISSVLDSIVRVVAISLVKGEAIVARVQLAIILMPSTA